MSMPERQTALEPTRKLEGNIKMDFQEMGWQCGLDSCGLG